MQRPEFRRHQTVRTRLLCQLAQVTRKYSPRGTTRLMRLLHHPGIDSNSRLERVVGFDDDLLIHIDTSSWIEWYIFFFGHYELETVWTIKRLLHPGFTAVDVGANVGCHSLLMGALVGAAGQVLACEPHPTIFDRLVRNVALNRLSQVRPIPVALSDAAGEQVLHSFPADAGNRGTATLLAKNAVLGAPELRVRVETLDDLLDLNGCTRLDLIKIDTEGNEQKVLNGAIRSIARFKPHVLFEFDRHTWSGANASFDTTAGSLVELGYGLYLVGPGSFEMLHGTPARTGNVLAVPNSVYAASVG